MAESTEQTATKDQLMEQYIEHVLLEGKRPASPYAFAKQVGVGEKDFFEHFSSFEDLEEEVWKDAMHTTLESIRSDKNYENYSVRERILAFFYTFFENMKARRSFALYCQEQAPKWSPMPPQALCLKEDFKEYVDQELEKGRESGEIADRMLVSGRYPELFWGNFRYLLQFWMKDKSKGFEQTDAAIEKSVNLSFDLVGRSVFDSVTDFGKFFFRNL